jgi:phage-related baseplate assembly protein
MRFDQINLPELPPPDIVESIDFEVLLKRYQADLVARAASYGVDLSRAVELESSPTNVILQVEAFAETIVRERVNAAVRAVMLPSAQKGDLDQIGSHFGTARMAGLDGTPGGEDDDRYRKRIQLALEAFSTAGPYGAYVYHAMKASPKIKDVAVYGPESGLCVPGQALNIVLSYEGDGSPTQDILDAVSIILNGSEVRPLTDQVLVQAAAITHYSVDMTLYVGRGPDPTLVQQAAFDAVNKYTTNRHQIGRIHAESGIKSAAFSVGAIERVVLPPGFTDIDPGPDGAAYCDGIQVTVEVVDDTA